MLCHTLFLIWKRYTPTHSGGEGWEKRKTEGMCGGIYATFLLCLGEERNKALTHFCEAILEVTGYVLYPTTIKNILSLLNGPTLSSEIDQLVIDQILHNLESKESLIASAVQLMVPASVHHVSCQVFDC